MAWCRWAIAWAAAGALAGALGLPSCGTDAAGIDACRKIENARCRRAAAACPELGLKGSTGLEECAQYSRDRCLHGLAVADPGPPAVDACVSAIEQGPCDVVAAPETSPACSFLKPAPTPPDAGPDAPADDATDLDAAVSSEGG
jgi:hypothetical protein